MTIPSAPPRSAQGFLLRIYWMIAGPVLLFFCIVFLVEKRPPMPSPLDLIFALAAAGLVLARYADIRWCDGTSADGQPASPTDFRRYARWVAAGAIAAWALARVPSWFMG